jgi:hypothetical protein
MPTNSTTQLARVVLTKREVVIQRNPVREVVCSDAIARARSNAR